MYIEAQHPESRGGLDERLETGNFSPIREAIVTYSADRRGSFSPIQVQDTDEKMNSRGEEDGRVSTKQSGAATNYHTIDRLSMDNTSEELKYRLHSGSVECSM